MRKQRDGATQAEGWMQTAVSSVRSRQHVPVAQFPISDSPSVTSDPGRGSNPAAALHPDHTSTSKSPARGNSDSCGSRVFAGTAGFKRHITQARLSYEKSTYKNGESGHSPTQRECHGKVEGGGALPRKLRMLGNSELLETREKRAAQPPPQTSEGAGNPANILISGLLDCEVRHFCCSEATWPMLFRYSNPTKLITCLMGLS